MFRDCGSTETVGSPKIRLDDVAAEGGRKSIGFRVMDGCCSWLMI
jgi:hypothetical protein